MAQLSRVGESSSRPATTVNTVTSTNDDISMLKKAVEKLIAENKSMRAEIEDLRAQLKATDTKLNKVEIRTEVAYQNVTAQEQLYEDQYEHRFMDGQEEVAETDDLMKKMEQRRAAYDAKAGIVRKT